jgi:hypothetical protein
MSADLARGSRDPNPRTQRRHCATASEQTRRVARALALLQRRQVRSCLMGTWEPDRVRLSSRRAHWEHGNQIELVLMVPVLTNLITTGYQSKFSWPDYQICFSNLFINLLIYIYVFIFIYLLCY